MTVRSGHVRVGVRWGARGTTSASQAVPARGDERGGRVGRAGGPWAGAATGRLSRRAPALLLAAGSVCVWWMSVPLLFGLDLPYPVALLGACLFVPLAAVRQWALATTDEQVRRGEDIRPVPDAATFALAACAALLVPAAAIACAFGRSVPSSVGLVLASDVGAVLLGAAVAHLAGPPTPSRGSSRREAGREPGEAWTDGRGRFGRGFERP